MRQVAVQLSDENDTRGPYRGFEPDAPRLADVAAAAIAAASKSYGDDPLTALTSTSHHGRRALAPAASAMERAHVCSLMTCSRIMGVARTTVWNARSRGGLGFLNAEAAASIAVETIMAPGLQPLAPKHTWRPSPPTHSVKTARAAMREVEAVLAREAATVADLVESTRLTEATVRMALTGLSDRGVAGPDPLTGEGDGARFWRLRPVTPRADDGAAGEAKTGAA